MDSLDQFIKKGQDAQRAVGAQLCNARLAAARETVEQLFKDFEWDGPEWETNMHDLPSLAHPEGHENALIRIKNRSEPIGANRFFSYFTQKDALATIVHLFEGLELSVEEKP